VNLVSQRSQPTGEGATYLTCAYDPDFHDLSYGAISLGDQHRCGTATLCTDSLVVVTKYPVEG